MESRVQALAVAAGVRALAGTMNLGKGDRHVQHGLTAMNKVGGMGLESLAGQSSEVRMEETSGPHGLEQCSLQYLEGVVKAIRWLAM